MDNNSYNRYIRQVIGLARSLAVVVSLLLFGTFSFLAWPYLQISPKPAPETTLSQTKTPENTLAAEIVDGIHVNTGLKAGEGLNAVIQNCTPCHSSRLITQNHMTREGWKSTIEWMQETQNLWDLGDNEDLIITYLATNYAPQEKGRRAPLTNIEWYELD